jgi:unsaturated rhamnogalacturonyl hydrolase
MRSNLIVLLLSFLCVIVSLEAYASKSQSMKVGVIFIGNSITEGTYLKITPPMAATSALRSKGYQVEFANCGISGYNSVDFLPGKKAFQKVVNAARELYVKGYPLIFSIMLGTNDCPSSGTTEAPVSAEKFRANMEKIVNTLHADFPNSLCMINLPLWFSKNTWNSARYMEDGLKRIQTYFPVIKEIVKTHSDFVLLGDTKGFNTLRLDPPKYYKPQDGHAGTFYLHPNAYGAKVVGQLWAEALNRTMKSRQMQDIVNAQNCVEENLGRWSIGNDPVRIGKIVGERFLTTGHQGFDGGKTPAREITYSETCTWLGLFRYAECTGDTSMAKRLIDRFYPIFGPDRYLQPIPDHVDHSVFGVIPMRIYAITNDSVFKVIGVWYADEQWNMNKQDEESEKKHNLLNSGLSWQTRYWVDDVYMISLLQSQAYQITGDTKYIDRAAHEVAVYIDKLQRPNGLFFHESQAPFYWGRGNGWVAAGLTELLDNLSIESPYYNKLLVAYQRMMATLLKYQKANGLWGQLIDDVDSWTETSGSAMFIYAMIKGVKRGWLKPEVYASKVRKAWMALCNHVNYNGDLDSVCEGTNVGNNKEFYLNRHCILGDLHGQAPLVWCATALLQK